LFSFLKAKNGVAGLTGIDLRSDGVGVVRVVRQISRPPRVTLCDFRAWDNMVPQEKLLARLSSDYDLKHARVTTLLNPDEYSLLLTEAPDVPSDELKSAVRWRIKDLIDFHINDATLDVFDVSSTNMPGKSRTMYVVAARNEAIQRRVDLCDSADINLNIIDIPEMAQRNLVSTLPDDNRGVVALSFGADRGLITITQHGEIFLSRSLEVGLSNLQEGFDLTGYFDSIVLEIQRSLDYFDSHFRQSPVAQLVVLPMSVEVPGLIEYLNGNLNVTASAMVLDQLVECDPTVGGVLQTQCLTALGAALRLEEKAL
jgi:MSHA biogenesis protein MshI